MIGHLCPSPLGGPITLENSPVTYEPRTKLYHDQPPAGVSGIYALCEPVGVAVRYVGQARDIQRRFRQHLKTATRDTSKRGRWLAGLGTNPPLLMLLEPCPPEQLDRREQYWQLFFARAGANLVNEKLNRKPQIVARRVVEYSGMIDSPFTRSEPAGPFTPVLGGLVTVTAAVVVEETTEDRDAYHEESDREWEPPTTYHKESDTYHQVSDRDCASCGGRTVAVMDFEYEDGIGWTYDHHECTNPKCLNPDAVCHDGAGACFHGCGCGDDWRERTEWISRRARNGRLKCWACEKWHPIDEFHEFHADAECKTCRDASYNPY